MSIDPQDHSEFSSSAPEGEGEASAPAESIAVIGYAGRFPGSPDVDTYWQHLVAGREQISFFSEEQLVASGVPLEIARDPRYVPARGVMPDPELFDAAFFGLPPREAEVMDPQYRNFLETCWHALENAGHDPRGKHRRCGVYGGSSGSAYLLRNLITRPDITERAGGLQVRITNDSDFLTTWVSYKLDLGGPSMAVRTACSTSLVAVHLACQGLLDGECDIAMAGGVCVSFPQEVGYLYAEGGIHSPDGHCRTFDADARGSVEGAGVGVVVLKRLDDALADGDSVRAVIRGTATNNDGALKVGYTAPSVDSQSRVIAEALSLAQVDPGTVGFVECHGSGTALGDPIEVEALTRAFRRGTSAIGTCALGSAKSAIGHLDAAAGVASLIKAVRAVEEGIVPPSLNFSAPNPAIDFDNSPFFVATEAQSWPVTEGPRRAGVSSFGIGGTNVHIVLEQAPEFSPSPPSRPWQPLVLSARGDAALEELGSAWSEALESGSAENGDDAAPSENSAFADAAFTAAAGRHGFARRWGLVAASAAEAAQILRDGGPRRLSGVAPSGGGERGVALLLPGLGDQHVEMGRRLLRDEPIFAAAVERCFEILRPLLADTGLDPRAVLFPGPKPTADDDVAPGAEDPAAARASFRALVDAGAEQEDEAARRLHQTLWAHPLTFTVEWALAQTLIARGLTPVAMIGYSLGEYVAATLAGVFTLEDALALVVDRARRVEALAPGTLLAVPLPEDEIRPVLDEVGAATAAAGQGSLALSAVNGRSLAVVGGSAGAVDALAQRLASVGVAARRLRASHAFHTPRLEPMVEGFRQRVANVPLQPPRIPFISNATGTWITSEEATDAEYWARHLTRTVRFADGVARLLGGDAPVLVECGPGQGLTALVRQHEARPSDQPVVPLLPDRRRSVSDSAHFEEAVVRLWLAGCAVDWEACWPGEDRHRRPLPGYAFQRQRFFVERDPARAPGGSSEGALAPALALDAETPLPAAEVPLERWFQLPGWRLAPPPVSPPAAALATAGPWLLVLPPESEGEKSQGDADLLAARELARALSRELERRGVAVAVVSLPRDFAAATSLAVPPSLASALADVPETGNAGPPRRVVYLGGASTATTADLRQRNLQQALASLHQRLEVEMRRSVEGLLVVGRGLAESPRPADASTTEATADSTADSTSDSAGVDRGNDTGGERDNRARLAVVALSAARVTGAEAPSPTAAAAFGALRVLGQEVRSLVGQGIDLETPSSADFASWAAAVAPRLLAELVAPAQPLVAWRAGRRWLPSYEAAPLEPATTAPLARGAACLVVGAHTVNGAAVASQLARRFGARLAAVVPPGLPPRSRWETALPAEMGPWRPAVERLRRLEGHSPELLLIPAALTEEEALERALGAARRTFGGLDAVFHAVGLPAAGLAQLESFDTLRAALAPKTTGAVALVAAVAREAAAAAMEPAPLVLVASATAHTGGLGQLEAAVGDRFLETLGGALAAVPAQRGVPAVRCLSWGTFTWETPEPGSGSGALLEQQRANVELFGIGEEALGETLERALAAEVEHLFIAPRPLATLVETFDALDTDALLQSLAAGAGAGAGFGTGAGSGENPREGYGRPDLSSPYRPPETAEERALAALWADAFGIAGLGADDDFFELAGNSLLALQIINRLQAEEGVELPLSALFETPTIAGLARRVVEVREEGAAPSMISGRIPQRPDEESSILSTDQERIYFLQNLAPDSPFYNIYQSERVFGPLNLQLFNRCFDEVVRRHEILRTTFHSVDGQVRQRVHPPYRVHLPVFDLSGLPEDLREQEAKRMVTACFQTVFHLHRLPLFQPFLLRMAHQQHVVAELLHHIVIDWISFHSFQTEVSRLYRAFLDGETSPLDPLPLQYADYAVWQREQIDSGAWDHHLEFWTEHLKDAPRVTELPVDHPRPTEMGGHGARLPLRLEGDISDTMRRLMATTHTTAFMAAVTVFKTLVLRLSHQEGLCVGSPIANNDREELAPLLGFFINHLVFYSSYDGNPSFRQALGRERDNMVASFAHRETPFAQLVEALKPPRDLSRVPLTQLCFLLLKPQQLGVPTLPGLDVRANPSDGHSAKFDFNVSLWDASEGFYGWMEYDSDLFDSTTVMRFGRWYRNLWAAAVEEPDRPLSTLSMLDAAQRHQALAEWAPARRRHPLHRSAGAAGDIGDLGSLLAATAAAAPHRTALLWDGEEGEGEGLAFAPHRRVEWSYGELLEQVDALAARLLALGVRPEEPVGLCCYRGPQLVVALLAILRAGGAYVPLDPTYPSDRLAYIATDAGCTLVLAQAECADGVPAAAGRVVTIERLLEAPVRGPFRPPVPNPDRLAYLIYTSGTTGRPKGVAIRHGSVMRLMHSLGPTYSGSIPGVPAPTAKVWSLFHSYAFDFSVFELWGALGHGGTLVVVPYETSRSPRAFRALIHRHQVSVLCQTPTAFSQLLAADLASSTPALASVRHIVFGGEALEVTALRPFFERYESSPDGTTVHVGNLWGVTEATVHQSAYRVLPEDTLPLPGRRSGASVIGRPHDDCSLVLLDPHGRLCAPGSPGEIHIGGNGLARGYWRRGALSARRFVPTVHPLLAYGEGGGRLYRTGDLGRWRADGTLEFLGRNDRQVQIKGFRVELGEVEARLLDHPAVGAAAVVAVDEGTPRARLAAYWVPVVREELADVATDEPTGEHGPEGEISVAILRAFLLESLPEYMVPATFQPLAALPVTSQGKLDLTALPAPRVERAGDGERLDEDAPQTPLEERLARLWSQVLGVAQVGRRDNFFEIGGDSILSMQLTFRAREEGLVLEPGDVFEQQTVEALARLTESRGEAGAVSSDGPSAGASGMPSLITAPTFGPVPLPPVARWTFGLWPRRPSWLNQSVLFAPREPLEEDLLRRALEILERRHESLRLRWSADAGARLVEAGGGVAVERLSLASLPEEARGDALTRACAEVQSRLDLEQGPVARALLVDAGDDDRWRRLLLSFHHLCVDAVSWSVLLDDLARTYGALREGVAAASLEAAPAASLAAWWRALETEATSDATLAEIPYWLGQVPADAPPWPTDGEALDPRRPFADVGTTGRVTVELEPETTERLLREVPAVSGLRVQEVLLAALGRALGSWRNSTPVAIHVEGHGREASALTAASTTASGVDPTAVVGWLTAVYPVLLEPVAADAGATLADARDALRAVPRGGLGWGLLRYLVAPALAAARRSAEAPVSDPLAAAALETLARRPEPEVAFNYLGRLDRAVAEDSPLAPAPESPGPPEAPGNPRRHLLEVDAAITAGGLRMTVSYSEERHRRGTVERLAQSVLGGLRLLVEAALSGGMSPEDDPPSGGGGPGSSGGSGSTGPGPSAGPDDGAGGAGSVAAASAVGPNLGLSADLPGGGAAPFSLDGLTPDARRRLLAQVPDAEDLYPLSPMQEGMLFHDLYDRGTGVYVEQVVGALEGTLDLRRFLDAWRRVAHRHGVLRTSFRWRRLERPLQVLHREPRIPVAMIDLRTVPGARERFDALVEEERRRGFQLEEVPLFRFLLARMDDQRYRFCWSHHHLLVDGWSLSRVLAEVFTAYAVGSMAGSSSAGDPLARLAPPPPFSHYIRWLQERDAEESRDFWRRSLANFSEPSPLPFDREPGTVVAGQLGHHEVLELPQREAVEALTRSHRVTLNTFFQGVWSMLLARYGGGRVARRVIGDATGDATSQASGAGSSREEVVFGVTVSGRPADLPRAEDMVGLFINTLPARVEIPPPGQDELGPWLQWLQGQQVELRRHEHVPLVEIQAASAVPRGRALFDSILVFENYPVAQALGAGEEAPATDLAVVDAQTLEVPHYPLTLSIVPALWRVDAAFDGALFDAATVRRILGHWNTWITALLAAPGTPLHRLPMMSPAERSQVLVQWSQGQGRSYPRDVPLHHLVLRRASFQPERTALTWVDAEGQIEAWSYGELARRGLALGQRLHRRGVGLVEAGPGVAIGSITGSPERQSRVAIYARRSPEWIVAMLGVLCAGGAYVPLAPDLPPRRRELMLRRAGVSRVLVGAGLENDPPVGSAEGLTEGVEILDLSAMIAHDERPAGEAPSPALDPAAALDRGLLPAVPASALAYIIFTSGSTGMPKAVAVPHRAVVRLVVGDGFSSLDGESAMAHYAPTAFDASMLEIWGAWAHGGRLALMPPEALTVEALGRHFGAQGVTHAWLTANLFAQVVAAAPAAVGALREVIAGGDVLSSVAVDRALALGTRVVNGYGPTEVGILSVCRSMDGARDEDGAVPIGRPIAGTEAFVVDGRLRPLPPGAAGELLLGGDGLAWGYWGDPGRTAVAFVPHPFGADGGRLYRTGDRVRYIAAGELAFLGRLDDQVKIRGFRVEPRETEAALLEHPAVAACAVAPRGGAGDDVRLVAWVVPTQSGIDDALPPSPEQLREHLSLRLPRFAVPESILFLETLPHTASGKVDRRALPDPGSPERQPYRAPETSRQRVLAGLIGEVLKVDAVGLDDDFFALGGHSLLATRLASAILDTFGVELRLRTLFERRTLEALDGAVGLALARRDGVDAAPAEAASTEAPTAGSSSDGIAPADSASADSASADSASADSASVDSAAIPLEVVDRSRFPEGLPLSPAQERLWFLERLQPGAKVYHLAGAMRLEGDFHLAAAAAAVTDVVRRHESLRTTFAEVDGVAVQRVRSVAAGKPQPLPVVDLSALPAAAAETLGTALLRKESQRSYDLEVGPLVRVFTLRFAAADHVLTFFMHHIISDAWSLGVLLDDFAAAYAARRAGGRPLWQPLTVHYGDFAVWQRRRLEAGGGAQGHLEFWQRHLAGAPPELTLPTDHPRPARQDLTAAVHRRLLPWGPVRRLETLAAESGGSLFHGLVAVVSILLGQLADTRDLVLGTTQGGRVRRELEPLVGFFIHTLPLRLRQQKLPNLGQLGQLGQLGEQGEERQQRVQGSPSFAEYLKDVKEEVLTAFEHQEAPFERLVETLVPHRDLSRHPMFQVMVQLQSAPGASAEVPGLSVRPVAAPATETQFDLGFDFLAEEGGLAVTMVYASALFDATTIERWGRWLEQLLGAAVEPGAHLATLSPLSAAEERQLLEDTGVGAPLPAPTDTVVEAIFQRARSQPETVAVEEVAADGSLTELTYGELAWEARQLARRLHRRMLSLGLDPRTSPVAVRLGPSARRVVSVLGILAAGAPVLPVDPEQPPQRLAQMVRDCRARLLLTSPELQLAGGDALATAVELAGLAVVPLDPPGTPPPEALGAPNAADAEGELDLTAEVLVEAGPVAASSTAEPAGPLLADLAYILYTSGSTGEPNGVAVRHKELARYAAGALHTEAHGPYDRVLQQVSFSFDPTFHELVPPLMAGSTLVVPPPGSVEPRGLTELVRRLRISIVVAPSALLRQWVEEEVAIGGSERLTTLRSVDSGGEAMAVELPGHLANTALGGAVIQNLYGPTEVVVAATAWWLTPDRASSFEGQPVLVAPIGRPLPGRRMVVLLRGGLLAPPGIPGALWIREPGLAQGYYGRPRLTAQRFVPDPWSTVPGQRAYRTGDRARWRADGQLEFHGRRDDQVKIRGTRVEVGEVEAALAARPEVERVAVVVRPDPAGGHRLVAYCVAADDELHVPSLRRELATALPAAMVPSLFITLDELPLTAHAKIDRRALADLDLEAAQAGEHVPPETPLEHRVVEIWQRVLGVERVGLTDDFFELGGHSLLATRLLSRVRAELGVELPVRGLFEEPTVARMVEAVETAEAGSLGAGSLGVGSSGSGAHEPGAEPSGADGTPPDAPPSLGRISRGDRRMSLDELRRRRGEDPPEP